MKTLLLAALLLCPAFVQASFVKVISPTTAQTYSFSDIKWNTLRWNESRQQLTADITFSNYNYVTHYEPLMEESYRFEFPGVKFDRGTGTFYMRARDGRRVDVAELSRDLIGRSIKPLPGTVIYVVKQSGRVVVALTATNVPQGSRWQLHWVEDNEGWSLDNLTKAGIASLSR